MRLNSVYEYAGVGWPALYRLLEERHPTQNISHKELPSIEEHITFVRSKPYLAWYYITTDVAIVGSIYLTRNREVGIGIIKAHQGKGYGTKALAELSRLHPGRMLANINPDNAASLAFFHSQGFKPLQVTYARS